MKLKKLISGILCTAVMLTSVNTAYALDGNNTEPWERSAETHRENLKSSIGYLEAFDTSAYTADSVSELNKAIDKAKKEYEDDGQSGKDYYSARNQLEYARAKLVYKETGTDGPNKLPFRELSTEEIIDEMGAGINLGNTLDGHSSMLPSETAWQPGETTKDIIKSMHDAGYNTIRMPVTWGKKIKQDSTTGEYTIDEAWLSRVNEVVDYAISQGMYVIINIHHDGVNWSSGWLNIGNNDIDAVMEKFAAVWKIIAERFKDYDEHLIFESMNEMTSAQKDGNMWNGGSFEYDVDILRNLNQLFVNTVRATGSNNTKRYLASKGHFAYTGKTTMPTDPMNEGVSHQMYSAHIYNSVKARYDGIKELADNYKSLGCPLILGEWTTYTGDDGSTATGYNDVEKAFQSEMVYKYAKVNNVCAVAWDIGVFEKNGRVEGGNSSYWSRKDMKPGFQSLLRGVMRGAYLPLTDENKKGNLDDVYAQYNLDSKKGVDQHPKKVTETMITSISCEDEITLDAGAVRVITPTITSGTNDVLVWTTSDDAVVTVSNGKLIAKKPGTATVTAYALNSIEYGYYGNYNDEPYKNAVKKEIAVTVNKKSAGADIKNAGNLTVFEGKSALIEASAENSTIFYTSDDESIATVNAVGRVFAKKEGRTTVRMTTDSGKEATVEVEVTGNKGSSDDYVEVGIFVLYNDKEHGYWENEIGETVKISQPGTYTLTYDIAEHQTQDAKDRGITDINNLTAIYLKDTEVHNGDIAKSSLNYCKLAWRKIEINDQKMTILEGKDKAFNPINTSGVFDSGRPVNSWEGNDIEGVSVSENTAVFTDIKNPTKVTITFTVTQLIFDSKPFSYYTDLLFEQADSLDRDELSTEEEKAFDDALEKLKDGIADGTLPMKKMYSLYSNVKTIIDSLLPEPPVYIPEKEESTPSHTEADSTPESSKADSSTESAADGKTDSGNNIVIIIGTIIIGVIAVSVGAVMIVKNKKKR